VSGHRGSDDHWTRLELLFRQALDLPPTRRRQFVDGVAADDADLRSELASLLAAHEAAEGMDAAGSAEPNEPGAGFLAQLDAVHAAALVRGPGAYDPDAGDAVGPFRIVRRLGHGGMGVVYLAEDPRLDRKVALKLLPPWLAADDLARGRLTTEAKAASALDHANIATIYEIDESADGRLYLAMAYYPGESLADRIARGPLGADEAVAIARQIAGGLAAAHGKGIVHRDVKPANVMVTPEGRVKILDFGIAKVAGSGLTRSGTTLGTMAYMSPEQARADAVDGRSDIWALGVLLYEMLTGKRPFRAEASEVLIHQIRHDDPEPLEAVCPAVPVRLARLVARCLEKDPDLRPASAREVLDALDGWMAGGPGGSVTVAGRRSRRSLRRATVAGLGTLAVAAVGYGAWSTLQGGGPVDAAAGGGPVDAAAGGRSIAVLPFDNLSGTEEAESYARGLHDDLLTRLSGISGFTVISRRAVAPYRGSDVTTAAIAAELGVRWVVEGGVAQQADRIQVNARLVDPRTETLIWAESYERSLTTRDLFALQGEIITEIARSLETRLTPEDRARIRHRPTADLPAYRLYVEGRTHLDQRSAAGLHQGAELFRRAIALDPAYAPAWAGLADALTLLAYYGHTRSDDVVPDALDAVGRALSIDAGLAEAHASLGLIHQSVRHDGPAALRELRTATQLNPSYARAHHWLGILLIALGRLEEAAAPLRRAVELDPTSPPIRVSMARWYQFTDSLDHALAQARRAQELAPSYPSALMLEGEIRRTLGQTQRARAALERALQIPGVNPTGYPGVWVELALLHHAAADTARARALVDRLEEETPPFVWAAVHAGLGERDTALVLLSRGPVIPDLAGVLRYQPVFDSLRSDPRFHELVRAYDRAWGLDPDARPGG
jgi:eukaryotic-like serine/threonine-protein kinase